MEPCPAESTKRSLSSHLVSLGLNFKKSAKMVYPMGALPKGSPGWPEFAFWIASAESTRMALTVCCCTFMIFYLLY